MQITELAFPACKQGRKKEPTDLSTEDLKPRLTGGKLVGAWGFEAESDSVQKLFGSFWQIGRTRYLLFRLCLLCLASSEPSNLCLNTCSWLKKKWPHDEPKPFMEICLLSLRFTI